jgi:hypothetical protein
MEDTSGRLIEAWIRRYEAIERYGSESIEAKHLFWAYDELDERCRQAPEQALGLINLILHTTQNEYVLANLAAGPLEALLVHHGKEIISKVESYALSDMRFRSLLSGVFQNLMDDQTWGRVLKASAVSKNISPT